MRNTAYLILAALGVTWCAWRLIAEYARNPVVREYLDVREGDAACRPDGKPWNTSGGGAFVILVTGGCPFCESAKPFEAELEDYGRAHHMPTFYVVPKDDRGNTAARELLGMGKSVIQASRSFGVSGVPTFMRVTDQGAIKAMWTGTLPSDRHDELLATLTMGTTPTYETRPSTELQKYISDPQYQILAISQIGLAQTGHATILSLKDLAIRAPYELDRQRAVVVDCGSASTARDCQRAAQILIRLRFTRVVAVGLSSRNSSCS